MTGVRVRMDAVSKKFCAGFGRSLAYALIDLAREFWPRPTLPTLRRGERWAVRDATLSLGPGDALAVVGHNGAGKTTLLRLLEGVLRPDTGRVRVAGRTTALIELGVGFNPMLTGEENILLSASLQGRSRQAARALVAPVLAFAELEAHGGTVVRAYSTGMRARLAYAIAAMLKPDILLVDEVLAVGDVAFQRKCLRHMRDFLAGGGTLVLVSHAVQHIHAACTRAILLEAGTVVAEGPVDAVLDRYLATSPTAAAGTADAERSAPVRILDLALLGPDDGMLHSGAAATATLELTAEAAVEVICGFGIWSADGWTCVTAAVDRTVHRPGSGAVRLAFRIPCFPLAGGTYLFRPIVADAASMALLPLSGAGAQGVAIAVAGANDLIGHGLSAMGQLVHLDGEWARR